MEFLTFEEAAARLGNISVSQLKRLSRRSYTSDPLPVARFGRAIRVPWGTEAMDKWIERRIEGHRRGK